MTEPASFLCERCGYVVDEDEEFCEPCRERIEEARNDDLAIIAMARLDAIRDAYASLGSACEAHGTDCSCFLCRAHRDVRRAVMSLERPGFDSLFAEGWRAHGITPWTWEEQTWTI